ncbi:hypothetical protein ACFYW6_07145 [Streptomyces sp. NPDC002659]|uniref:hypothetical protein n=1 Tax=Streptomyces sp. NPDC002659 TaxID=3364656 RepID=UPI0036882CDF
MTPYERLLAEQIPTGTFGGERPPAPTWSPTAQAQHVADLEAALDGWEYAEHTRQPQTTRHLQLAQEPAA